MNGHDYDGRDDVWSAGLVFVELITRRRLKGGLWNYLDTSVNERRDSLIGFL